MIQLGMLVLPIAKTLPSRPKSSTEIFSMVAPTFPGIISKHSILTINSPSTLPAANTSFLKHPPPLVSFPAISPSAKNWLSLVSNQSKVIKQALLKNYPLALSDSLGDPSSFANVAPIKISVNLGARPVNRTICLRPPAGMEKSAKKLIDQLLKEGVIRRWDKPSSWCAPCCFVAKSDGSQGLLVNFRGLISSSNRVCYPFSSIKDVHLDVENGTFLFMSLDLI